MQIVFFFLDRQIGGSYRQAFLADRGSALLFKFNIIYSMLRCAAIDVITFNDIFELTEQQYLTNKNIPVGIFHILQAIVPIFSTGIMNGNASPCAPVKEIIN